MLKCNVHGLVMGLVASRTENSKEIDRFSAHRGIF